MALVSLSTLRDTVRTRGDFTNSSKFVDSFVNSEINAALCEYYEIMADAFEGYFDTTASTTLTPAQDWVALPADFWRLSGLDILLGGRYRELNQIGIQERNNFQTSTGTPTAYRLAAGSTRGRALLYPTPSSADTVRFTYSPTVVPLVADGDSFEFMNGGEEYVITGALLRLDQRQEKPLGERQQELMRVKARVTASVARRRQAEPEMLIPRDRFLDDDWWLF